MAYNFKEYMERPDRLTAGHRMCAGCGASIALRNVMKAVHPEDHAVICNATSLWKFPLLSIHTQHGRIPTFTQHLKMPVQPVQAWKLLTEPCPKKAK